MTSPKLTKLELRIMEALWNQGACSIREIQEAFQILPSNGAVLFRFLLCGVRSDNAAAGIACKGLEHHITDRGSEAL